MIRKELLGSGANPRRDFSDSSSLQSLEKRNGSMPGHEGKAARFNS